MADKNIYTVVVADDEDELRDAVCTMTPWEALQKYLKIFLVIFLN